VAFLKRAVTNIMGIVGFSKPKVQELKPFSGAMSFKELKNFMWNLEHYFNVVKINLDA
jgi:hypothetical protein